MKKLASFAISVLVCGIASAQITLDQDDFPYAGFNKDYYSDSGDSVDVGNAGASQMFDFSTLNNPYDTFNVEFVDPSSTPFPGQHNGASLAYLEEYEEDSATQQIVLEIWQFMKTSPQESKYIGTSLKIDTAYIFSQAPPTSTININSAYNPHLTFVSAQNTYQSNQTFSGAWSVTLGNLKHDESTIREIEVDAYGTFSNPWQSFDALRFKVREIEQGYDTINGQADDYYSDTSHYFEYWTNDFGFWVARAYTDDNYSMIYGVDVAAIKSPIGIDEKAVEYVWSISPNPTNEFLYVEIDEENINYRISDMTGRQVKTGRLNSNGRNQIDVSNLDGAYYIIEIFNDDKVYSSKKFLVQ